MRTYTKPTLKDRAKMAAIWIALGSAIMFALSSCAPQKELMENYKREQAYLTYRGKRPAIQDIKEEQVLKSRDIKVSQRRAAQKKH